MSNIEYLRQLHRKKLYLKRTQYRVMEFYSYEKDLVLGCVKDLIFHLLRSRKESGLWTIYYAW